MKRIHLKTFSDMNKSAKLKTSRNKGIEYKQQGNIALQLLVKSQNQQSPHALDLKELMTYPLTPVPYCVGTPGLVPQMTFWPKLTSQKVFIFSQQMLQMLWSLQTMILFW